MVPTNVSVAPSPIPPLDNFPKMPDHQCLPNTLVGALDVDGEMLPVPAAPRALAHARDKTGAPASKSLTAQNPHIH
jgi:hypothetical protein